MALFGTGEMFGEKNVTFRELEFGVDLAGLRKPNNRICGSVMEFESNCTKHSLIFIAQAICSTSSVMVWCTRISIEEGFREFL